MCVYTYIYIYDCIYVCARAGIHCTVNVCIKTACVSYYMHILYICVCICMSINYMYVYASVCTHNSLSPSSKAVALSAVWLSIWCFCSENPWTVSRNGWCMQEKLWNFVQRRQVNERQQKHQMTWSQRDDSWAAFLDRPKLHGSWVYSDHSWAMQESKNPAQCTEKVRHVPTSVSADLRRPTVGEACHHLVVVWLLGVGDFR